MEVNKPTEVSEDFINIGSIVMNTLGGIVHFWYLVVAAAILMGSALYVYAHVTYVPQYQAVATVIIDANVAVETGTDSGERNMKRIAQTFPYIVSNRALLATIADDLHMHSVPAEIQSFPMIDTNMFTIYVTAADPEIAYEVLQSLLRNYPKIARFVLGSTSITVLEEPQIPTVAINWKNTTKYAGLGAAVGAVMVMGIIFLTAVFKTTIHGEEELGIIFSIKGLGSVPMIQQKKRRKKSVQLLPNINKMPKTEFAEAIHILTTRLEREQKVTGAKSFLVTSTLSGEGKTVISANLALALAAAGKKVAIVDMDLHNSSVLSVLGVKAEKKNVVDYLNENVSLNDIVITEEATGLKIIPGGHASKEFLSLLSSERVKIMLKEAEAYADYIIIDTPPAGILVDASIIAEYVDTCIYIVRQDYVTKQEVRRGVENITDSGCEICGSIINMADEARGKYGYGYSYGYGRRYGYGRHYGYGKEKGLSRKTPHWRAKKEKEIGTK